MVCAKTAPAKAEKVSKKASFDANSDCFLGFWVCFVLGWVSLSADCFLIIHPLYQDFSDLWYCQYRLVVLPVPVIGTTSTGYWYYQYQLLVLPVPVIGTTGTG